MAWIEKPKYERKKTDKREERQTVYKTSLWKKLRLAKLRENPLCEVCELEGKVKLATNCHHLKSFINADNEIERDSLAYDINNLISLCDNCHYSRFHNGGDLEGLTSIEAIKKKLNK